jgi:hypothetical protein
MHTRAERPAAAAEDGPRGHSPPPRVRAGSKSGHGGRPAAPVSGRTYVHPGRRHPGRARPPGPRPARPARIPRCQNRAPRNPPATPPTRPERHLP